MGKKYRNTFKSSNYSFDDEDRIYLAKLLTQVYKVIGVFFWGAFTLLFIQKLEKPLSDCGETAKTVPYVAANVLLFYQMYRQSNYGASGRRNNQIKTNQDERTLYNQELNICHRRSMQKGTILSDNKKRTKKELETEITYSYKNVYTISALDQKREERGEF